MLLPFHATVFVESLNHGFNLSPRCQGVRSLGLLLSGLRGSLAHRQCQWLGSPPPLGPFCMVDVYPVPYDNRSLATPAGSPSPNQAWGVHGKHCLRPAASSKLLCRRHTEQHGAQSRQSVLWQSKVTGHCALRRLWLNPKGSLGERELGALEEQESKGLACQTL